jgi:transposase-like protein|tara:strand:- start:4453 stop:4611 length:159 start_codon:yes stop_codon:yes gene_type:complete
MNCRQCKVTLTKDEVKLIPRKGYICKKCAKLNTQKYNKKRAKAIKDWRKLYG